MDFEIGKVVYVDALKDFGILVRVQGIPFPWWHCKKCLYPMPKPVVKLMTKYAKRNKPIK